MDGFWKVWRIGWLAWCALWAMIWIAAGLAEHALLGGLFLAACSCLGMLLALIPGRPRQAPREYIITQQPPPRP